LDEIDKQVKQTSEDNFQGEKHNQNLHYFLSVYIVMLAYIESEGLIYKDDYYEKGLIRYLEFSRNALNIEYT
jgi:hypothetical protein